MYNARKCCNIFLLKPRCPFACFCSHLIIYEHHICPQLFEVMSLCLKCMELNTGLSRNVTLLGVSFFPLFESLTDLFDFYKCFKVWGDGNVACRQYGRLQPCFGRPADLFNHSTLKSTLFILLDLSDIFFHVTKYCFYFYYDNGFVCVLLRNVCRNILTKGSGKNNRQETMFIYQHFAQAYLKNIKHFTYRFFLYLSPTK